MSVVIATMGKFRDCCIRGGGGGAPPVYQYEQRGEEPPIHVDVIRVYAKKPKMPEIKINIGDVRSERKI